MFRIRNKNQFLAQMGADRFVGMTYDSAGNLINDGTGNTYTYDAENRISTTAGVTYTYDGDGERVKKSTGTLYWGLASNEPLAESDLVGNISKEFIFFPSTSLGAGSGKRIARFDPPSGAVHYYFSDHLGSSNVVTNATGAIIEEESDFYPFGGERVLTDLLPDQRYKFTGKERDTESNLDYFGARYYSSPLGRFITPDEFPGGPVDAFSSNDPAPPGGLPYADISNPQSLNKYSYTYNNPLRYTDPNGHDLSDGILGALNSLASNFAGAQRIESDNPDLQLGQHIGDAISVVAGTVGTMQAISASSAVIAGTDGAALAAAPAMGVAIAIPANGALSGAIHLTRSYKAGADFSPKTKQDAKQKTGGKCEYCEEKTSPSKQSKKDVPRDPKEGTTDHYKPKSRGGTNDPKNARHACLECNLKKGDKTPKQWKKEQGN